MSKRKLLVDRAEVLGLIARAHARADEHTSTPLFKLYNEACALQTTASAEEPVARGTWGRSVYFVCSVCCLPVSVATKYCPNCGALMGDSEHE